MTDFTTAQTGGTGFVAEKIETTAGTYIVPDQFMPTTDNALKAPFDLVREKAMRGTRLTHVTLERARNQPQGTITYEVQPSLGYDYFTGLLGATASQTAVTAVASSGAVVTTNGISTIPVTGAFVKGTIVLVNVTSGGVQGALTEPRVVQSYTTGSLKVGELVKNAATTTGMFVSQPAETKFANSILTGAALNTLPSLTIESNKGSVWSWIFPGSYLDKTDWTFAKDTMTAVTTIKGMARPIYANGSTTLDQFGAGTAAMSTYAPNAGDEANALRPFTSVDGFICAGGDPDATGTSSNRAALGITDAKISYNNALISEAAFNNSGTYLIFPGDDAGCMFDFNEIATSLRPDVWTDYIQNSTATSFSVAALKNYGTATTPNYGGVSFWMPNIRYSDADPVEKVNAINKTAKKGEALVGAGIADYLQIFVMKPS